MGAGIEVGWAHEVADVLKEQVVEAVAVEGLEGHGDHAHLHMAHPAGVQLHGGDAGLLDLEGVHVGFQVGLDDAEGLDAPGTQLADEREQKRRLAGARARHDVHEERALLGARRAEGVGRLVVGRQDVLLHFDDARLIHDASFAGAEPCRPAPSKYCSVP